MTDLEHRKKLLVAESEIYRELLKLEIGNLRLGVMRAKRKMSSYKMISPLLMFSLPMAGSMFIRRRFTWKRLGALGFLGWQLFRKYGSIFTRRSSSEAAAPECSSAEEYLSRRI